MEILNLRKIEKNVAVLWDGKDDTLFYLNNEFISLFNKIRGGDEQPTFTIAKFEKHENGDLLFTSQFYFEPSDIRIKTIKIGMYIVLENGGSIYDTPQFHLMEKDEAELEIALINEDYILAAKIRDIMKH